jgi:molybdopterin/thiamine biosynthesis adenylyltransferase
MTTLRHVVLAESALADLSDLQTTDARRLALQVRDGGESGVVSGADGTDVLVVRGDASPASAELSGVALVCQITDDGVRCRAANGGQLSDEVEVVVLPHNADVFDRVRGIFETDILRESGVAILGLGSGGSFIACELAKAGVGHFLLVDHDRLEVGNVSRHVCGLADVGRLKVNAMRDRILDHNPTAEVTTAAVHIDGLSRAEVRNQITSFDPGIVIGATDTRESRLLINRICLAADLPLILAGVYRRAYGGLVQRVIPGLTACYQCFVQALPDLAGDAEISSEADAAAMAYSDRPVEPQPGLSSDVLPVALHVTKLALLELVGDRSPTFLSLRKDLVAPLYQWVNRREADSPYADLVPLGNSVDGLTILRWYGILLPRRDDCVACSAQYLALKPGHVRA